MIQTTKPICCAPRLPGPAPGYSRKVLRGTGIMEHAPVIEGGYPDVCVAGVTKCPAGDQCAFCLICAHMLFLDFPV